MPMFRLDKLISLHCNVSRRDARQLIKDRAVTVNGAVMLRAEEVINTESDEVSVKGHIFDLKEHIYIMLNKPAGVISATNDPKKETVIDIIPPSLGRKSLFPVGRLDRDTTGLLIITDDGAFAHRVMSPSHHVFKTYIATLAAPLESDKISLLECGITLDDGAVCLPARVEAFELDGAPAAKIQIREGKYHQVKRMIAACGNRVEALRRVGIGSLELDKSLAPGECRELTEQEKEMVFVDI